MSNDMQGENNSRAPRRSSRANGDTSGGVQSVDRAVRVLEILAATGGSGVSEVATDLDVHKSTAFRLLAALEDRGLVEQNSERGKYQLGFGILRLASAIPVRLGVVRQARPMLDELATKLGETINLAVIREHYAVNVAEALGPSAISAQTWMGQLTPLHATSSGKILLAHLDRAQRDEVLDVAGQPRLTDATITSRSALEKQLEQALTDGFATTFEEYEVGLNAVAVPVRDHTGGVVAAVSVSGPAFRLVPDRIQEVAGVLQAAGSQISRRLGHLGS
jgi:DNA-binding IclR family transcriptional regulator